ncbi:hypothetical protein [Achromobacter xylosoxidans]|uniref:hypothetical protein n=1 Tax=Alcaligenes xylosoxydans xylosoxydans TaxID=85698 RepID=UPI0009708A96|nr:hypothetical protein [Achromobacter xylosoxidans]BEG74474.1 hypothetical protein HBIAX_01521 [Achromobacter xylosoxidans]
MTTTIPAGWKLVPVEPTIDMVADADEAGNVLGPRARRIYAAMLNAAPAAPASPVSTVEQDAPAAYLTLDEEGSPCMLFFDVVEARTYCEVGEEPVPLYRRPAPAAGDARDAARLDWLEQHDGRFYNKDRISSIVGTGFLVAGDEHGVRHQTVRAAIDAAIAAQRQGDA